MPKAKSQEGICETQPSLAQSEDETRASVVGSTQDPSATWWVTWKSTWVSSISEAFPPTHLGPNSLGQAVGHGQHPLGSNKGAGTDVGAVSLHTDYPWSPPSHGFWVPEGGVWLMGGATDWRKKRV